MPWLGAATAAWAQNYCGDGACNAPPENRCNCRADCGAPPATEGCSIGFPPTPVDDDCDGMIDCADPNCLSISTPLGSLPCASCANGACAGCERCGGCASCPSDCGSPVGSETNCGDGMDNDCSGTADCSDLQCLPACCGNGVCNAAENHCNCAADCGPPPATEINCTDGRDNECDGAVDCVDTECFSLPICCGNGTCSPWENACNCPTDCGPPTVSETICNDSRDDDCDGFTDCSDSECVGQPTICGDGTCTSPRENACNCPSDCGAPPVENCNNSVDDDCDGMNSCADYSDCGSVFGISCNLGNTCGNGTCSPRERCNGACPLDCGPLPPSETNCADGLDNDCNGTADCADPVCLSMCCGNGTCDPAETSCNCSVDCGCPAAGEVHCADGRDNDCDGSADCADVACHTLDADGDGYTTGLCGGPDCDDGDPAVNPGAVEICGDGIDNDCDGGVDCADSQCPVDADGDGFPIPPCGNDCDDTDATVHPGAGEICTDLIDNDCDGFTDCADAQCPGVPEICNDGLDNNCNGTADCADSNCFGDPACCGDGTCDPAEGAFCLCAADCGNPTASETGRCFDFRDNDCDGVFDCLDRDCCATEPSCRTQFGCGDGSCNSNQGENPCGCQCDCGAPPATEMSCNDGQDNDCDMVTDCADPDCQTLDFDGDGFVSAACGGPDCDDFNPAVNPGATESCTDGVDNDCDGGNDCVDTVCHGSLSCEAACISEPTFGIPLGCFMQASSGGPNAGTFCDATVACCYYFSTPFSSGWTCGDFAARCCAAWGHSLGSGSNCGARPTSEGACNDGLDDECDGAIDCVDTDCRPDADGDGEIAAPCGPDCDDTDSNVHTGAVESCADGLDNDCDAAFDCDDTDCAANPACCPSSSAAQAEQIANSSGTQVDNIKNRSLSFTAGDAGQSQTIRVTFGALPGAFSGWSGRALYVGNPVDVCELAGVGSGGNCPAGSPTAKWAKLQCSVNCRTDWSQLGTIHAYHEGVVPGASYGIEVIDCNCDVSDPNAPSPPLSLSTPRWGDVCGGFVGGVWTASDNAVNITSDVVADLEKFGNRPGAPVKARADTEPGCLDLRINITDVTRILDAFRGAGYPFHPTNSDPCLSTCP